MRTGTGRILAGSLAVMAMLCATACAPQTSTMGSSIIDPAYRGGPFRSLVVEAEAGLQERDIIESTASHWLNQAGVPAQVSLALLPPTREPTVTERRRAMAGSGAQGLLLVTPVQKEVIRDYIPPSHFPIYGYGSHGRRHDHFGIGTGFGFGHYDPGVVLHEPQARYEASLYTLPQFTRVWTAELSTRGASGMDFNAVAERFAGALVQRLAQDGMIAVPMPAP